MFITAAQFLEAYDERRVSQLCSSTGTPITSAALPTNTTLLNALNRAAGMITAACRVGQRYQYDDLVTLSEGTDPGSYVIQQLNADLAFGLLNARRGLSMEELSVQAPMWAFAQDYLNQLRLGERIFDIAGDADAGLPDVVRLGVNKDTWARTIGAESRLWGSGITTNSNYNP